MMKTIFRIMTVVIFSVVIFSMLYNNTSAIGVKSLNPSYFASAHQQLLNSGNLSCSQSVFFGLEPWYYFLPAHSYTNPSTNTTSCVFCFRILGNQTAISSPGSNCNSGGGSSIPLVVLAIVDDLLRVAGMAAVVFILFASFKFITSSGNPDGIAKARKTLIFALVGLVLSVTAISIVTYLGQNLIK